MKKGRIYTIHYGDNADITRQFVSSIVSFLHSRLELVIVNNSKNICLDDLTGPHIKVFNSDKNLGYFGGLKYGIEQTSLDDLDYLIICNNDIQIDDADFFVILDRKLDDYDVIAPSIMTPDGIQQNPHREKSPSKLRKYFYRIYYINYLLAFVINKSIILKKYLRRKSNSEQKERTIFSPHGAFIIFNTSFFKNGGFIDDGYFLYGEEDSVAAMCDSMNLKTGFVPELKIFHKESLTTGKWMSINKFKIQKSAYKYIRKNYTCIYN